MQGFALLPGDARHDGDHVGVAVEAKDDDRDGKQGVEVQAYEVHAVRAVAVRPCCHYLQRTRGSARL